ncbi:hypothetical protein A3J90_07255 [candidate division WOR-1 bacterium RIFOXYC2_FULL_37_10]|uniref:SLH domain-containing protein n=1 Tax=candidate division WOR-1 bacterium RIFOXYB2_FULL_37_13 TaxID=1802579 RepID=A0A1F4SWZ9_UNCSA|nr:MAG: hypothetical protein A2310_03700 [candidate division WOR-1 bacterium RIFOXYB2_FULL_37_13]OGC32406.1 MAG: hypothetical protein A3J90_07255 [candidate division WOR-1 bacterium RIFOXYC2_FULL_37_10]
MIKVFKSFLMFTLIVGVMSAAAFAEVKFKDVPADHWAAKSVYDLVRLGITTGYPDGTFRGSKNITRYETAVFLAKLADKLPDMDMSNIQTELNALKNEIAKVRKSEGMPITGEYEMISKIGNLLSTGGNVNSRGPAMAYRLKTEMNYDFDEATSLKVKFDTLDSGFGGTTRDLATEMINVLGTVKINPMDTVLSDFGVENPLNLEFAMGNGDLQHVDATGFIPSETGIVYKGLYSGVGIGTNLLGFDVMGGYKQAAKTNTGVSATSLLTGSIAYNFKGVPVIETLKLTAKGDYYAKHPTSGGVRDLRGMVGLFAPVSETIGVKTTLGIGSSNSTGWLVGGELDVANALSSGLDVVLRGTKVGSSFIYDNLSAEEFDIAGLDFFDRPLENGTVNLGGKISQKMGEKLEFEGKGDLRLSSDYGYGADKAKSRATGQVGFAYEVAPSTKVNTFYRVEQDPTISETTDLAAMGLVYKF